MSQARLVAAPSLLFAVLMGVAGPLPAAAQSLLAGAGLGLPVEPLDARSRALGGGGVGLSGWNLLPNDPAAAAGLVLPTVSATYQPTRATLTDGSSAGNARFPNVGVSYPYGGNVFWVQLLSFLDQEWEVLSEGILNVSGMPVRAQDQYRSTGGIGEVRLGWARRLVESVSVGASVGSYTGKMERTFLRLLNAADLGSDVEPFVTQGRWEASGTTVGLGLTWDPGALLHVSASALWSGDLELAPVAGGVVEEGSYAIPVQLRGGGMFTLASQLALSVGVSYADWSETGRDLGDEGARAGTWSYGGGLEWSAAQVLGRPLPLRLGARHVDLPFTFAGNLVSERILSGGFGLNLLETEIVSLARLDVGLERGTRSGGDLSEKYWRTTISVQVAGN